MMMVMNTMFVFVYAYDVDHVHNHADHPFLLLSLLRGLFIAVPNKPSRDALDIHPGVGAGLCQLCLPYSAARRHVAGGLGDRARAG